MSITRKLSKKNRRRKKIKYSNIIWLLAVSETLHNLEESIWFPSWLKNSDVHHPQVTAFEFRIAIVFITLLIYLIIFLSSRFDNKLARFLSAGMTAGILFNVFMPHLIGTIITAKIVPGVITGVILNIPVCVYLIMKGLKEKIFNFKTLAASSLIFTVITLPLLQGSFALGRFIESLLKIRQ